MVAVAGAKEAVAVEVTVEVIVATVVAAMEAATVMVLQLLYF